MMRRRMMTGLMAFALACSLSMPTQAVQAAGYETMILAESTDSTGQTEGSEQTDSTEQTSGGSDSTVSRNEEKDPTDPSEQKDPTEATTEEGNPTDSSTEDTDPTEPTTEEEPVIVPIAPTWSGKTSYTVKYAKNRKFTLNIKTDSDGKLSYKSSNTAIAKVSSTGQVTIKSTGSCTFTVKVAETEHYKAATKKIKLTVWKRTKALSFSASYRKSSYYKKMTKLKLTGTTAANMLKIARSQVGYHESSSASNLTGSSKGKKNYTEFGRFYGLNGEPWCAMFVNWVARVNDVPLTVIPKECAVRYYWNDFQQMKRTHTWSSIRTGAYQPQKGDIIFYSYSYKADTHHIGYVEKVTYTGSNVRIKVVEGNKDNAVRRITMKVSRTNKKGYVKSRKIYITGVASPAYQ